MRDSATTPNGRSARSPLAQHWTSFQRAGCVFMLITAGVSAREHVPLTVPFHVSSNVVDGYYATAHWIERSGAEFLGVIAHKFADAPPRRGAGATPGPDLMRFEFLWEEVK
jgi:hypothetical protein